MAEADEAFEREIIAFTALKPELLEKYAGQFVAIYQGKIVGNGDDRISLVKDVYGRFGEVPCYVEKVTSKPLRRVRIPSIWKAE